ncbi:MAG TPA: ROK family protein [Verrucomicrobiae bacterium]|jgi:glucokinase
MLLGIEIGGSKLQLVLGDEQGKILQRKKIAVDRQKGGAGIRDSIASAVRGWKEQFVWRSVGVGYGGPVDWRTGQICCSHHVEGWNDFPLGEWLRELTGTPVAVDNDSDVAAFGEALAGAGRGFNPVFYTNSGSGVGGGLVVDGRVYHGAKPGEAELGHVRLDKSGTIVEERCSGWAVDRKIRALKQTDPDSVLCQLIGDTPGGEARHLAVALASEDATAQRILRETAEDLAFALSHGVHLFHPEVIVLGGGLALIGEPWRAAVAEQLPHFVMHAFRPPPPVKLAALGEDIVPVGALALAKLAC